jgi:predicted transcriptional regulator
VITETLSEADILNAISDEKSLLLFNTIALSNTETSDILISRLNLSRKQFYTRISSLIKVGLIKRENSKHFLTSLGKVVYKAETMIGGALKVYWKLKAIDSLDTSINTNGLPDVEHKRIVEVLIGSQEIREIILSREKFSKTHLS